MAELAKRRAEMENKTLKETNEMLKVEKQMVENENKKLKLEVEQLIREKMDVQESYDKEKRDNQSLRQVRGLLGAAQRLQSHR
jgi:hypothetical protein